MTTIAVVGAGIVGSRLLAEFNRDPALDLVVVTSRPDHVASFCNARHRFDQSVRTIGPGETPRSDIAVLACPARNQLGWARQLLATGSHVVTLTDDLQTAQELLKLDKEAARAGLSLVIGAGFAPGLSTCLAGWLAGQFDQTTEIHIARNGAAGPACAHQHHRSLRSVASEWRDGRFVRSPGGTGRELVWFPAPIHGADCYRADSADPELVHAAHPHIGRIATRVAANRRDRLTSWLPPLLPPHTEGGVGAIRVEARGTTTHGAAETLVAGASGRPGAIAAAVAAETAQNLRDGDIGVGASSLASLADPGAFLARLRERSVIVQTFIGSRLLR